MAERKLSTEQRAAIKDFKKTKAIEAKKHGWKSRDWALYKVIGSYFFTGRLDLNVGAAFEGYVQISLCLQVKPLVLDDLFWEIFGLEENKRRPIGLRANGAFVIKGPYLYFNHKTQCDDLAFNNENLIRALDESLYLMDMKVKEYISAQRPVTHFNPWDACDGEIFPYDKALIKMLLYITENNFSAAYELAETELAEKRLGSYGNRNGNIYDYIKAYCKNYEN
jgi:hypothetical protein